MKELDISYRSVSLLEEKLFQVTHEHFWVTDWPSPFPIDNDVRFLNVLTTGLFYQRIFEPDYWPENDFSLFCLSYSVKEVLINLFGFDEEVISVIPRYLLFPKRSQTSPFPQTHHFHLVHPGRISPQKNIEFILLTTFYFQMLASPDINLTLMGNFDNDHHRNILGVHDLDYQKKIEHLIESLPWPGKKPIILSEYNSIEWVEHFPKDGLFFSASNLISEDFSVAIAQVQESLGSPCLIPFWGGFKDVKGDNVAFYSIDKIASSHESFPEISKKAKSFVEGYLMNHLFLNKMNIQESCEFSYPVKINRRYLSEKIIVNKARWGKEIESIQKGQFHLFANSLNGQNFFKEYIKLFREVEKT